MSLFSRFTNIFRSRQLDRDLADEQRFHLEARIDQYVQEGMSPADAERAARRHFGNLLALRESSRDARLFPWLESLFSDARYGARMLRKDPIVTAAAILSLSLAIGACAAAFSLLDALLLRPLPVRDPGALVALSTQGSRSEDDRFSGEQYSLMRRTADVFGVQFNARVDSEETFRAERISANGFDTLGVHPALGRLLLPGDDHVVVIGYDFWMSRFGGSPSALAQTLLLNGRPAQIVGVLQAGFTGLQPGYRNDLWLLLPEALPDRESVSVWARLRPGVTAEQFRQPIQALFPTAAVRARSAASGRDTFLRRQFQRPLWILAGVVGLVLLIACSNVANLLLARSAARAREMAMRVAVGAARVRLMQHVLVESALLAGAACLIGWLLALWMAPVLVGLLSTSLDPVFLDLHTDGRLLVFLAAVGVATTLLFGMLPAARASATAPIAALRNTGTDGTFPPILAAQVAFSVVVLFVAGLLLVSFRKLTTVKLGFSPDHVLLFAVDARAARAPAIAADLLDRVRHFPGVQAASASRLPLIGGAYSPVMTPFVRLPGQRTGTRGPQYLAVSPGFFETMRIPLLSGRDFNAHDDSAVIVNQIFARSYFPGEDPLGKRFEMMGDDPQGVPQEIVGVVRDGKYNSLREPPSPAVYTMLQGVGSKVAVRLAGSPLAMAGPLRQEILRVHPGLRVTGVTLQSTQIEESIIVERLLALLAGFFGLVAVTLAAVGLYGVLSYAVVRRTREIGIRAALGARAGHLARLVVADLALTVGSGVAAGLAGGFALSRFVRAILFEVRPTDAMSFALPVACILLASALAALGPAIRAARVDPVVALRQE